MVSYWQSTVAAFHLLTIKIGCHAKDTQHTLQAGGFAKNSARTPTQSVTAVRRPLR